MMRRHKPLALALVSFLTLFATSVPAQASQPITTFDLATSTTQAGGHPDLSAVVVLGDPGEPEVAKNITVNLPVGLFGNPGAVTRCEAVDFALNQCPISSQVGLVDIRSNYEGDPFYFLGGAPIYNMETQRDDETARLSFVAPTVNIPINIPFSVRTASDYGLRMNVSGIPQQLPLAFVSLEVWGFPAAAIHNDKRFGIGSPGSPPGCPGRSKSDPLCNTIPRNAGILVHPFTINPAVCTGKPLITSLGVQTYQDPDNPSQAEADYEPTTGCEKSLFNPVLNMELTTEETDAPAGLDLQLRTEQFLGFATTPSNIRSSTITFPEGLSINPDAADGQTACSDAQANFYSEGPAQCPDSSKIGRFDVHTPALLGPLTGSLYIGEPKPGDQYRLFMIASGFGVNAKLTGSFRPDPRTGQITAVFEDLPQVPFDEFNMHLFASDRGLVATPTQCRLYEADSLFVPWNDKLSPQHSRPTASLTSGPHGAPCPGEKRPFNPRLVAGMSTPVAGAFSNFHLRLDRDDGDQFLGDLNFRMPPGFTGDLRGITYCAEAAIAAAAQNLGRAEQSNPSCPGSSQIGTTNVAAGPGSHPFNAVGKMYLSGPLNGAPLSLAAITPALAGPYDYGTIVVRVSLHVDPLTAQVKAISDRVPSIVGGIPIRMRSIQVNIDRENFTINPTNCSPLSIDSQGIGDQGTLTDFSSYFHAVNCYSLRFKPKMAVRQVGKKGTRRSSNPQLQFDLTTRPGDANIKTLSVTLPSAFAIDQRHIVNLCTEKELAEKQCAGHTPIGKASTTTPLLDKPLEGPVFAVSGSGGLPKLAFILNGQVNLLPRAETKTISKRGAGQLQTTVPVVPDAPIGHFKLTVFGGKTGYLVNTRDICIHTPVVRVAFTGQNGKTLNQKVKTKTACKPNGKDR